MAWMEIKRQKGKQNWRIAGCINGGRTKWFINLIEFNPSIVIILIRISSNNHFSIVLLSPLL